MPWQLSKYNKATINLQIAPLFIFPSQKAPSFTVISNSNLPHFWFLINPRNITLCHYTLDKVWTKQKMANISSWKCLNLPSIFHKRIVQSSPTEAARLSCEVIPTTPRLCPEINLIYYKNIFIIFIIIIFKNKLSWNPFVYFSYIDIHPFRWKGLKSDPKTIYFIWL